MAVVLCALALQACSTPAPVAGNGEYFGPPERNIGESAAPLNDGSGIGGTGGTGPSSGITGPLESRRGSTPPGKDRAGDQPSSGAIHDPTGSAMQPPARQ